MSHQLEPETLKMSSETLRIRLKGTTMLPGQKAELERRIELYETHPEQLVPFEDILAKLKRA